MNPDESTDWAERELQAERERARERDWRTWTREGKAHERADRWAARKERPPSVLAHSESQ